MKILLVYPETPNTFWGFKAAMKFISKKASEPPLGLVTVAALLPTAWEKKLVDLNIRPLKDKEILWADYVFLGGMNIQSESFEKVVARCNHLGVKVVAGGPMCTTDHTQIKGVDHFILPGNKPDTIRKYHRLIRSITKSPKYCMPGIIK